MPAIGQTTSYLERIVKKLTQQLKQALAALAAADAGEMLTRTQKDRYLVSRVDKPESHRRQVALWASADLSKAALDYTLAACRRMDAALTVLHMENTDVSALRDRLGRQPARFVALGGRPEAALRDYLAANARVAFLVLDGDAPGVGGLAMRAGNPGVPVVLVAGDRPGTLLPTPYQGLSYGDAPFVASA